MVKWEGGVKGWKGGMEGGGPGQVSVAVVFTDILPPTKTVAITCLEFTTAIDLMSLLEVIKAFPEVSKQMFTYPMETFPIILPSIDTAHSPWCSCIYGKKNLDRTGLSFSLSFSLTEIY